MAADISSRAPDSRAQALVLFEPIAHALAEAPVPLLVLRLPQFERIAWREGKRAARRLERVAVRVFDRAAHRVLRAGDLTAHDPGSDLFVIAMTAPARADRMLSPMDCRAVLERLAAAVSLESGLRVETGWTLLRRFDPQAGLQSDLEIALERGSRERERYEFFSAIGHELRTPLTAIRGYIETLIDGDVDPERTARFLETARREALRMGRLLDGMFEFSLLDISATALSTRHCDLARQIQLACEVVRPLAQNRGITVRCTGAESVLAALDPDACLQLGVNLLENAIKYGREGGLVLVQAQLRGGEAVLGVDDDGPGIAPAERDSIFGLRVRGSLAADRPGTGIGLAIVKMIAERAGGTVRVLESPLGGARFEASLPLKAESAVPAS